MCAPPKSATVGAGVANIDADAAGSEENDVDELRRAAAAAVARARANNASRSILVDRGGRDAEDAGAGAADRAAARPAASRMRVRELDSGAETGVASTALAGARNAAKEGVSTAASTIGTDAEAGPGVAAVWCGAVGSTGCARAADGESDDVEATLTTVSTLGNPMLARHRRRC